MRTKEGKKITKIPDDKKYLKAKRRATTRRARREVWAGTRRCTSGLLTKKDLKMNKRGAVVSRKLSMQGRQNKWLRAVKNARQQLKCKEFIPIKKGLPLHRVAKEWQAKMSE